MGSLAPWKEQKKISVSHLAEAEKILNRTLAYQAAIAVHELKDRLNIDVAELRLTVTPNDEQVVGSYRVACHITEADSAEPAIIEVIVRPDEAVAPTRDAMNKRQG